MMKTVNRLIANMLIIALVVTSVPQEAQALRPMAHRNLLDSAFKQYLITKGLSPLPSLLPLFTPEIKEVLLEDRALRPVFLLALPMPQSESPLQIFDKDGVRLIGGEEVLLRYTGFRVSAYQADRLAREGQRVIVGVTDEPSYDSFLFTVANGRQAYIPLADGTWLGLEGCGEFLEKATPPYYIGHTGLLFEQEANNAQQALTALRDKGGNFIRFLGYRRSLSLPDYNGNPSPPDIPKKLREALGEPVLGFNRVLSCHRLNKFPQLSRTDPGLANLRKRVSRALVSCGLLAEGTVLSPSELMKLIMRRLGRTEAVKQNSNLYKASIHEQDFTFAGEESDSKEFLTYAEYIDAIDEGRFSAGESQALMQECRLSIAGIYAKLRILTKMLSWSRAEEEAELFFPSPIETLRELFVAYFSALDDEYLRLWAVPNASSVSPIDAVLAVQSLQEFYPPSTGIVKDALQIKVKGLLAGWAQEVWRARKGASPGDSPAAAIDGTGDTSSLPPKSSSAGEQANHSAKSMTDKVSEIAALFGKKDRGKITPQLVRKLESNPKAINKTLQREGINPRAGVADRICQILGVTAKKHRGTQRADGVTEFMQLFAAAYNKGAEHLVSRSFRTLYQEHVWAHLKDLSSDSRVLELAAGGGDPLEFYWHSQRKMLTALDQNEESLMTLKFRFPEVDILVSSWEKIKAEDSSFDACVSTNAIPYVKDREELVRVLNEVDRVLRFKNGKKRIFHIQYTTGGESNFYEYWAGADEKDILQPTIASRARVNFHQALREHLERLGYRVELIPLEIITLVRESELSEEQRAYIRAFSLRDGKEVNTIAVGSYGEESGSYREDVEKGYVAEVVRCYILKAEKTEGGLEGSIPQESLPAATTDATNDIASSPPKPASAGNYGPGFMELLSTLSEYERQDTFAMTKTSFEGKGIPENSARFLLKAIDLYFSDTPLHDISLLQYQSSGKRKKGEISASQGSKVSEPVSVLVDRIQEAGRLFDLSMENIAVMKKNEAKEIILKVLSLREGHLALIDETIREVTRLAPEVELFRDILVYFRRRVDGFFLELKQRAERLGIKAAEDLPKSASAGESKDLRKLLLSMGYYGSSLDITEKRIRKFLADVDFDELVKKFFADARNAPVDSFTDFIEDIFALLNKRRDTEEVFRTLVREVGIRLNGKDIFEVIEEHCADIETRKAVISQLVSCTAISQMGYILLRLAGFDVECAEAPGHVLLAVRIAEDRLGLIDFSRGAAVLLDEKRYYERRGEYLILKDDVKLTPVDKLSLVGLSEEDRTRIIANHYPIVRIYRDGGFAGNICHNIIEVYKNIGLEKPDMMAEASALARKVAILYPEHPMSHGIAGEIYILRELYPFAIEPLRKSLRLNPHEPHIWCDLGEAYFQTGKFKRSAYAYRRALALKPDYARAHHGLGIVLYMEGKWNRALEHFRIAVSSEPDLLKYLPKKARQALRQLPVATAILRQRHDEIMLPSSIDTAA